MRTDRRWAGVAAVLFTLLCHQMDAAPAQTGGVSRMGSISGRVLWPDGTPASDLRIALIAVPPDGIASPREIVLASLAQTDQEGKYVLSDVPPGRYSIITGPVDEPVYIGEVSVVPAGKLSVSDFRLSQRLTYSVRGRVKRAGGIGPGDRVVLSRGPRFEDLETEIARDGSFEFLAVRPGPYLANVEPLSFELAPLEIMVDHDIGDLDISIPPPPITGVKVEFTASVEGGGLLPLVMIPLPTVEQAKEAKEASEPNAPAEIPTADSTPIFWARTPQRTAPQMARFFGDVNVAFPSFSLAIPPGDYVVSAASIRMPQGYTLKSIRSGSTDLLKTPLTVAESGTPPIEVTLAVSSPPPWVKVEGRMTEIEKLRAKPTHIFIENEDLSLPLTASVDSDGRFEFPMALPGTYHVTLVPRMDDFDRLLTIRGSGVVRLEMPSIPPLMKVRGKIEGAMPEPNASAQAWLHREPIVMVIGTDGRLVEDAPTAAVRSDGSFDFGDVVARDYRMFLRFCPTATPPITGEMVRFNPFATRGCSTFEAAVLAGKDIDRAIVVDSANLFSMDEQSRRFSGRLTVDGKPVALRIPGRLEPAPRLSGSAMGEPHWVSFQSATDGTISFEAYDGEYDVTLTLPLGASIQSFAKGTTDLLKQPLRLTWANRDDLRLQLVVDRTHFATVSGRVTGLDLSRAPVMVTLKGGSFSESLEASVNPDGTFAFSGVATGRYEIALAGAIHRSVSGNVLVAEMVGIPVHKAEDVTGLEIVVPATPDTPAILRIPQ